MDRAGRPGIRARAGEAISPARRGDGRLPGPATARSDIPPPERARDGRERGPRARRDQGPCRTGSSSAPSRRAGRTAPAGNPRTRPSAATATWRSCGSGPDPAGAGSDHPARKRRRRASRSSAPVGAHAAGVPVRRVRPVRGGARAARKSAASTATAAGSSTRAGIPCPARERRASSAPARRNAARSRSLRGCRALPRGVPVPPPASARYGPARAPGPGREDPPGGHSQGPAPGPARGPASPADPDRAARADGSGRCRSSLVCVRPVMRTGPVTSVAPWGAWQSASHGAVPAVSRGCAAGGEPAGPLSAGDA